MTGIELHNFRRFPELPFLEFGKITFLVGSNNSGKSSVSKAIAFMVNNLLNMKSISLFHIPYEMDFSNELCKGLNIVDFNHTLSFQSKGNTISIGILINEIYLKVDIIENTANTNNQTGLVSRIQVVDKKVNLELYPGMRKCTITFKDSMTAYPKEILPKIKKMRTFSLNSHCYESFCDFDCYEEVMERFASDSTFNNPFKITCEISGDTSDRGLREVKDSSIFVGHPLVREIRLMGERIKDAVWSSHGEPDTLQKEWCEKVLTELADKLNTVIKGMNLTYIPVSVIPQLTSYATQSESSFSFANLLRKSYMVFNTKSYQIKIYPRLCEWIKKLGIGSDYKIDRVSEECYRLLIKSANSEEWTDTSSVGRGCVQLMNILLQIGLIGQQNIKMTDDLFEYGMDIKTVGLTRAFHSPYSQIIIEEPELCLHPSMQSMLADVLYEASLFFMVFFIVETHSEYLIRRTQGLYADINFEAPQIKLSTEDPLKVFYFPSNALPYDMEYRKDGYFKNNFGSGFFDEASKLNKKLIFKKHK